MEAKTAMKQAFKDESGERPLEHLQAESNWKAV